MVVSMRVMSTGTGYKYLLRSVAAGDGRRDLSTPLTRYYAVAGCPPGRWLGAGLGALGTGDGAPLVTGDQVSEEQLQRLIGHGCHPVTGEQLGTRYYQFAKPDPAAAADGKPKTANRKPVAGFDYTFSVPKSVSVLWGLADAGTQELLVAAHHAAVAEVLGFMEREVVATRIGSSSKTGPVVQADTAGVMATAFDHWDSRSGDPQLHTHVVISNKVHTVTDSKWRAIDGRPMHAATVAVSELYNAVLADKLTATFGLAWQQRDRGRNRNPAWELRNVPQGLVEEFSTRSRGIESATDQLIAEYHREHGRGPSTATLARLRQQATLATRPDKQLRSMADLTADWRHRAAPMIGDDAIGWAARIVGDDVPPSSPTRRRAAPVVLRADDVPADVTKEVAATVLAIVADKRSTWTRWNVHAEASRQLMGCRFASLTDRNAVTSAVVAAVETASLKLTPEAFATPREFTRTDGTSRFRPRHQDLFTSQRLLDAEAAVLELSRDSTGPRVEPANLTVASDEDGTHCAIVLGDDQYKAVYSVATSGRVVDVLVGPAGAGKTTTLAELRRVWEAEHGAGSVVGLAPSATAAAVLGAELDIATENTAKWWYDHEHSGRNLVANQLVIVDEASLAGTLSLHQIATHAADVGAKLLLVGDHAQLQSVTAGGVFQLLVDDRDDAPELNDVHRFRADWEKAASLQLRHANPQALDAYDHHQRISGGNLDAMVESAYSAWRADLSAGRSSLLIADNNDTVAALNERARADRIATGIVAAEHEVTLHDGLRASRGDLIVTRQNDRRLIVGNTGWVRNGDCWTVLDVMADGSSVVRREGFTSGGAIALPAAYVAAHVELGYAVTAHRAQGATVETAHAIISEATPRENLYVAMTRGRSGNYAYVATDTTDDAHAAPHPDDAPQNARQVLDRVLTRSSAEPSAHQTAANERETWGSISQLGAEYETLLAAALHDRWKVALQSALAPTQSEATRQSPEYGTLAATLYRADVSGFDVEATLPRLAAAQPISDSADPAVVLNDRLTRLIDASANRFRGINVRYLHGMYPLPSPTTKLAPEMKQALDQRISAMDARADELLNRAIASAQPWLRTLGTQPAFGPEADHWRTAAKAVAAYRERYEITGTSPLGDTSPATAAQHRNADRIQRQINDIQYQQFSEATLDFGRSQNYGLSR